MLIDKQNHNRNFKTMLKKLLFLTVALYVSVSSSYSQQYQHEDKIIAFYGQQRFAELQQNDPALIDLLDNYIDHGFYVQDVNADKYLEFTPLQNIPLATKGGGFVAINDFLLEYASPGFNPLNYNFFPSAEVQVFKLSGVNKIIYILPQTAIISQ
jgi:hypothetical protein